MKNEMLVGFIIVVIIVGAGSFYSGMRYGKSQSGAKNLAFNERPGFGGGLGGMQRNAVGQGGVRAAGGGFVNGSIIAKDDKSITVKSADGGSKIVLLSGATQIMKSVDGSASDLEVGKNVMITGQADSAGSITAQSIQLRPASPINATSTPPVK